MKKHLMMLGFVLNGLRDGFKAVISPFIFSRKQMPKTKFDLYFCHSDAGGIA